jgi:hypothetical protein
MPSFCAGGVNRNCESLSATTIGHKCNIIVFNLPSGVPGTTKAGERTDTGERYHAFSPFKFSFRSLPNLDE